MTVKYIFRKGFITKGGANLAKKLIFINVVPGGPDYEWLQIAADSFARLKRLSGYDVSFSAAFESEMEFAQLFKISSERSDTNYDKAIESVVHQLVARLQQSGDVYKRPTKCNVCQICGQPSPDLKQSRCISCGGPATKAERDGYFFRVKRHGESLLGLVADASLIFPRFQQSDLVNIFSNKAQEDVLIALVTSREKKQLFPVAWLRFMAFHLVRCGYSGGEGPFSKLWPEAYVFVPRDLMDYIFYWCGLIAALKLPRPGGFFCHSPLRITDKREQQVSPLLLAKNYGREGLRIFMQGVKIAPGENNYSEDQVIQKINHDLANELGNVVSRVVALVSRFAEGMIPPPDVLTRQTGDLDLRENALAAPKKLEAYIDSQDLHLAVKVVKNLIGTINCFIELSAPWQLAASQERQARLNTILYNLCEALRFLAVTLKVLLPDAAHSVIRQLGIDSLPGLTSWQSLQQWGLIPVGTKIIEQPPLFPRIVPGYGGHGPEVDLIMREEMARINMVVARVVSAETVVDFEDLLQLILYDGRQRRRVLAPVARSYNLADLTGKKVVMFANLRPVEFEGHINEGEVLVTKTDSGRRLLIFADDDIPEGSLVLCLS
jgi:methionyl-tRNA synthetase